MTAPHLEQRLRQVMVQGEQALCVETDIPEDAPAELREGLARRAVVNGGGMCPCGATIVLPSRARRRAAERAGIALEITVEHELECPASTEAIIASAAHWAVQCR